MCYLNCAAMSGTLQQRTHPEASFIPEIRAAYKEAETVKEKPTCIVAETYMGHPISFMNDDYRWHGKPPNKEQAEKALAELEN